MGVKRSDRYMLHNGCKFCGNFNKSDIDLAYDSGYTTGFIQANETRRSNDFLREIVEQGRNRSMQAAEDLYNGYVSDSLPSVTSTPPTFRRSQATAGAALQEAHTVWPTTSPSEIFTPFGDDYYTPSNSVGRRRYSSIVIGREINSPDTPVRRRPSRIYGQVCVPSDFELL